MSPPKRLLVRRRRTFRNTVVGCFTVPTATGFFRTAARFFAEVLAAPGEPGEGRRPSGGARRPKARPPLIGAVWGRRLVAGDG